MQEYHRIGQSLSPDQRSMYFRLGAEIQNRKTVRMGFKVDGDCSHDVALMALEATNWKSQKAARALINVARL